MVRVKSFFQKGRRQQINFKLFLLKMQLLFLYQRHPSLNGSTAVGCDKVLWGEVTPNFLAQLLLFQRSLAPLKVALSTL